MFGLIPESVFTSLLLATDFGPLRQFSLAHPFANVEEQVFCLTL